MNEKTNIFQQTWNENKVNVVADATAANAALKAGQFGIFEYGGTTILHSKNAAGVVKTVALTVPA